MTRRCKDFTEENLVYETVGCEACGNCELVDKGVTTVYHPEGRPEYKCKLGYELEHLVFRTRMFKRGKKVFKVTKSEPKEEPKPPLEIDWALFKERISVLPKWAAITQDPGALMQHHGFNSDVGLIRISASPAGPRALHITVHLPDDSSWLKEDVKRVLAILNELGLNVVRHWGGLDGTECPWLSIDFNVENALGALALVGRYHRGCLKTGTYVSSVKRSGWTRREDEGKEIEHETGSVFCTCGWFKDGYNKANFPEGWD